MDKISHRKLVDQVVRNKMDRDRMLRIAKPLNPLLQTGVFNFQRQQYFGRGWGPVEWNNVFTCVRANESGSFDLAGNFVRVAANRPKISNAGLRMDAAGPTQWVRNNTGVGLVAGLLSSGGALPTNWQINYNASGLTNANVTIGAVTKINGIDCVPITIAGTPSGASTVNIVPEAVATAANGQAWVGATWLALASAGTLPGGSSFELDELDGAGAFLAATTLTHSPVLDATLRRYSVTRTNNNASTARERLQIRLVTQAATPLNVTVYIGLPTLEIAATASTIPQRTTGSAITPAADAITFKRVGYGKATFVFDNDTTQTITGITKTSAYAIPTNLNRGIIKRVTMYDDGVAAGAGTAFNPADVGGTITLSNSNFTASTSNVATGNGVRGLTSRSAGLLYLEFQSVIEGDNSDLIGLASSTGTLTGNAGSVGTLGYSGDGTWCNANGFPSSGGPVLSTAGRIGIAINFTSGKFWLRVNGGNWNNDVLANQNPATGAGGFVLAASVSGVALFPYARLRNSLRVPQCTVVTGAVASPALAFIDAIPSGFSAWG